MWDVLVQEVTDTPKIGTLKNKIARLHPAAIAYCLFQWDYSPTGPHESYAARNTLKVARWFTSVLLDE